MNGDQTSATKAIHIIYNTNSKGGSRHAERICLIIKNQVSKESTSVGYFEAFFKNEFYRRANWTNSLLMMFTVLTGLPSVLLLANISM